MPNLARICGAVRPEISALQPYQADCVVSGVKLDANENGWDVPGIVKEELGRRLRNLSFNRYPDMAWTALRTALAARYGVAPEQILIGNGSSELIMALLQAFTGHGIRMLYPSPSFSMYPVYAAIAGAAAEKLVLDKNFRLDADMVIAGSKKPHTGLVMLCSPNNPTGNAMPEEDIERIVANSPCLVAVDEAYYEFHGRTALPLVEKYANVVVLRTFSKAYGLAGARVGYLIGQAPVVKQIGKVLLPYNVNALSLALAETVVDQVEAFLPRMQTIIDERERMTAALGALPGLKVYPSRANFLLCKTPLPGSVIAGRLRQAGVNVKDFDGEIADTIRVSLGTPADNDACLQALCRILTEVR